MSRTLSTESSLPSAVGVSVIVPAYQAEATIDRCLDALEHQTVPRERCEIIVVDDGSTDGTAGRVRMHPGVRLLAVDHGGPAAARNLGARRASGEIVLFTDADCEPLPDWIERMEAPFHQEGSGAGVAGAKGAYLTRQRELVARFVQLEYEDKYARLARHMADTGSIDFVDTYAAAYRRDLFLANGGFDTGFPLASVEDQEFSFRLSRQGHRLVFVPEARVIHHGHASNLGAYCRKKFRIGYWKAVVLRQHPEKIWRDSHTPQVLKAQMGLLLCAGLGAVGAAAGLVLGQPWARGLLWAAAVAALLFFLTALPFVARAWPKDPPVALLSAGLLAARALALGFGLAAGVVAHLLAGRRARQKARPAG